MCDFNDYYNYSLYIDNYRTLPKYNHHHILIGYYDKSITLRIERGKHKVFDDQDSFKCMTRMKLLLGSESVTNQRAKKWSKLHGNSNLFSILSQDLFIDYEKPYIATFEWIDNRKENFQLIASINWHNASIQFCDFNDPNLLNINKNNLSNRRSSSSSSTLSHTYHKLMKIVFDTYCKDTFDQWRLIDNCSSDILILYFKSSILSELRINLFDHQYIGTTVYKFSQSFNCDSSYANAASLEFSDLISKFTCKKFDTESNNNNENSSHGWCHYTENMNTIMNKFHTRLKNGAESHRFLNSKSSSIDCAHISNEGIDLEFCTSLLMTQEIIEIEIDVEIIDRLFDHTDIRNDILQHLTLHPEDRSKFLTVMKQTEFDDKLIDYVQIENNPFTVSLIYVPNITIDQSPELNDEKIRALLGFTCTKNELCNIFNQRHYSQIDRSSISNSPLEMMIKVKYKSFKSGFILSQHYKKIFKHDSATLLYDAIIDDCIYVHDQEIVNLQPPLKRARLNQPTALTKEQIFDEIDKCEHYLVIDNQMILFESISQLFIQNNNHYFRLQFSKNFSRQKHNDLFIYKHYPDLIPYDEYVQQQQQQQSPTKISNTIENHVNNNIDDDNNVVVNDNSSSSSNEQITNQQQQQSKTKINKQLNHEQSLTNKQSNGDSLTNNNNNNLILMNGHLNGKNDSNNDKTIKIKQNGIIEFDNNNHNNNNNNDDNGDGGNDDDDDGISLDDNCNNNDDDDGSASDETSSSSPSPSSSSSDDSNDNSSE